MKDTDRRRLEMFVRVRDFGAAHAVDFPAASRGAELFSALGKAVSELQAHAVAQTSGYSAAVHGTSGRAAARNSLRKDLDAIRRTARAMSIEMPGIEERFRFPRRNFNDQTLVATARDFAAAALPLKAEFVRHEMPADFLEALQRDIAEFEEAVGRQNRSKESKVAATASIDAAVESGTNTVRGLDALVRNKFRDDLATLAAWTSASHVGRPAKQPDKADTPAGATTTPPPAHN